MYIFILRLLGQMHKTSSILMPLTKKIKINLKKIKNKIFVFLIYMQLFFVVEGSRAENVQNITVFINSVNSNSVQYIFLFRSSTFLCARIFLQIMF